MPNDKFIIDYGPVNLKSLIITNDKEEYEKRKAQNNIGVLFEPEIIEGKTPIYAVGVMQDT